MSMKKIEISVPVSKYLVWEDIQEKLLRGPTQENVNSAYFYDFLTKGARDHIVKILGKVSRSRSGESYLVSGIGLNRPGIDFSWGQDISKHQNNKKINKDDSTTVE